MKEETRAAWELDRLTSRVPDTTLGSALASKAPCPRLTKNAPRAGAGRSAPEAGGGPAPMANRVPSFPGAWVSQAQAGSSCCPQAPCCQLFWEDELMSKTLAFVKYKNTTKRSAFDLRSTDRRSTGPGVRFPSSSPNSARTAL